MKKHIIISLLFLFSMTKAQVVIGNNSSNVTNNSVSLEFNNVENRGLILPYVEDKSSITENGTIIFDVVDKKVKYLKNGSWFDLSVDATGVVDVSLQSTKTERATAKVVIGANGASDNTDGILVLSDDDKAMILPKVASPHLNIINPSSGMMVYDTTARQLAVFNGSVWSFWKP